MRGRKSDKQADKNIRKLVIKTRIRILWHRCGRIIIVMFSLTLRVSSLSVCSIA